MDNVQRTQDDVDYDESQFDVMLFLVHLNLEVSIEHMYLYKDKIEQFK